MHENKTLALPYYPKSQCRELNVYTRHILYISSWLINKASLMLRKAVGTTCLPGWHNIKCQAVTTSYYPVLDSPTEVKYHAVSKLECVSSGRENICLCYVKHFKDICQVIFSDFACVYFESPNINTIIACAAFVEVVPGATCTCWKHWEILLKRWVIQPREAVSRR